MTARAYLTQKQKAEIMLRQDGKCNLPTCGRRLIAGLFQWDHIQDLQFDGDNEIDNWQAICTKPCHAEKTRAASKSSAHHDRIVYGKARTSRPMPGTKASGWKHKCNGQWQRRPPASDR